VSVLFEWPKRWNRAWTPWFVLLAVAAVVSFFFDGSVKTFMRDALPVDFALFGRSVGIYGDWPWLMLIGLGGFFVCKWRRRRDGMRVFAVMMLASTLAGASVNVVRLTSGRARPSASITGWVGPVHEGKLTIGRHALNAFPSGHTATAFGFFGAILFTPWWRWGLLLFPFAWIIGISRLMTQSHHLSDVCVAIAAGLFVAAWSVILGPVWWERFCAWRSARP